MDIDKNIKRYRISNNMTQSELAKILNVAVSTISSYENGSRIPSLDVLIKISEAFKVSIHTLIGHDDKKYVDVTNLSFEQFCHVAELIKIHERYNESIKK